MGYAWLPQSHASRVGKDEMFKPQPEEQQSRKRRSPRKWQGREGLFAALERTAWFLSRLHGNSKTYHVSGSRPSTLHALSHLILRAVRRSDPYSRHTDKQKAQRRSYLAGNFKLRSDCRSWALDQEVIFCHIQLNVSPDKWGHLSSLPNLRFFSSGSKSVVSAATSVVNPGLFLRSRYSNH